MKQKLLKVSKKKSCQELTKWIKSISNHFWWACSTCGGDEMLLKEKWTSLVFHVQDRHEFHANELFMRCEHSELTKDERKRKSWLKPNSDSFIALQKIVFDKRILNDLKYLVKFSHTGTLEVYHSLYNKWASKSLHFSYSGMIARSQLAALDFNSGCDLKIAKTKDGKERHNVSFSKMTANWSSKPIKEAKDKNLFEGLVARTLELVEQKTILPPSPTPKLKKNIALTVKPAKDEVIQRQKSSLNIFKSTISYCQ